MSTESERKKCVNNAMNKNVAEQTKVATEKDVKTGIGIESNSIYMEADQYIGNPYKLLGQVWVVKSKNGVAPVSLNDTNAFFEKYAYPIQGIKVDDGSKLKPTLTKSIIVDKKLSTTVSFLSYLETELNANSYFSLMVYNQAAGLIDHQDASWASGLNQWKATHQDLMNDPNIHCIFVVTGFSQKNVIRKKYIKYEGRAKGGYFGININGELSTSTEEYALDTRFGLEPTVIKSFKPVTTAHLSGSAPVGIHDNIGSHNIDKVVVCENPENTPAIKIVETEDVFNYVARELTENTPTNEVAATQMQLIAALNNEKISKLIREEVL